MSHLSLKAYAKINLCLDVTQRRPDGYHELRSIMQTIDLHDRVTLHKSPQAGIELSVDTKNVPCDATNLTYMAAQAVFHAFMVPGGLRIELTKNIPVAAGLGGGSADAAAVIRGLDTLYGLGMNPAKMREIGLKIGADVPFLIAGGTAQASGIGEILAPLPRLPDCRILLVCPRLAVSTKWVFEHLSLDKIETHPDTAGMAAAIHRGDLDAICARTANVLETVTITQHKIIGEIKQGLLSLGAKAALMSGSGPTVFAIFGEKDAAQKAKAALQGEYDTYLTTPIDST